MIFPVATGVVNDLQAQANARALAQWQAIEAQKAAFRAAGYQKAQTGESIVTPLLTPGAVIGSPAPPVTVHSLPPTIAPSTIPQSSYDFEKAGFTGSAENVGGRAGQTRSNARAWELGLGTKLKPQPNKRRKAKAKARPKKRKAKNRP